MIPALSLAGSDPLTHVVQHRLIHVEIGGPAPFFSHFTFVSNQTIMQVIAAALVALLIPRLVRRRAANQGLGRLVPRGMGNALEWLCDALRTQVARPVLGPYTDRFMPYLWSAFFFILTSNVLGLIPLADWTKPIAGHALGGTSTGNIMITAALAICTLAMIVGSGLRIHGVGYLKHFLIGPPGLNVFIALLEVIGLIAKTFALAIRLFANMVAGHILLAVLLSMAGMGFEAMGVGGGLFIAIPIIIGSVAVNFLKLFVAFLQAFIFTFLSAIFIGQAVNIHAHEEEHEPEGKQAPAPAAAH